MVPGLLSALVDVVRKPADLPWPMHLRGVAESAGRQLGQAFLTLAFLPYDAVVSQDAIGRTLLRLLITRKRLLEWQTSSEAEKTARTNLASFYATMWIAPLVALVSGRFLVWRQPAQLPLALPAARHLACGALDRLVDQPAHRGLRPGADGGATGLPPSHGAPDLAFFRDLCHRGGKLAAAG